jgi:hypothetical protein
VGRRTLLIALVAVALIAFAACGSDDNSDDADANASTTVACPFDGTTAAKTLPGSGSGLTTLESTSGRQTGCIDQTVMQFSNGTPVVSAGYTDESHEGNLVVRYGQVASGSQPANVVKYSGMATVPVPKGLTHVVTITVSAEADGTVVQTFALREKMRFDLSSAQVPASVTVSFG